ncbi:FadR/GntR family transcriptional regulator [Donghicola sp.]|jgi:GntR family transcriptional repressor for pyruvate dehydrogenase complex|uniref:FadR/GntR family transcriptional regulator n=1 Tax=Donghicola sp. TaxID=1929294 RepID=UPI0025F9F498|nr:FadR/GntR family transcriptional regulator [Donghicola sp.]MCT4577718.1 FadR family transcriptional regulator [Donghicola sp.]
MDQHTSAGSQGRGGRPPLSEKVYTALKSRITRGDYGPNEKLPAEKDLSAQYGVSRPVLRVALEQLREEGLIVSRQGAGNFVRVKREAALGYTPVETIADIQRCYEFRLTIEVDAAGLAAQRRNQGILDEMEQALDLLSDATGSRLHREDADFTFHLAIARASNNQYYAETLKALRDHIYVGMKMHGDALMSDGASALENVLEEHRGIYQAIADRDPDRARAVMRQHVSHSRERLFGAGVMDLSMQ